MGCAVSALGVAFIVFVYLIVRKRKEKQAYIDVMNGAGISSLNSDNDEPVETDLFYNIPEEDTSYNKATDSDITAEEE